MLLRLTRKSASRQIVEKFFSEIRYLSTSVEPNFIASVEKSAEISSVGKKPVFLATKSWRKMQTSLMDWQKIYVSTDKDDPSWLRLTLLHKDENMRDRQVILSRKVDELLSDTFERLALKLNDFNYKKIRNLKKRQVFGEEIAKIGLNMLQFDAATDLCVKTADGYSLDAACTSNRSAFRDGQFLFLKQRRLSIEKNVPFFGKFKIDVRLMVGFPVVPSVDVVDGAIGQCVFDWFVEDQSNSIEENGILAVKRTTFDELVRFDVENFKFRRSGAIFLPEASDVGKRILLIGTPKNASSVGIPNIHLSQNTVEALDCEEMIWEERQIVCATKTDEKSIRLLSYNVLADLYLELEKLPQEKLFFAHCPAEFQRYSFRYPLLLKELAGYNADLMCLQEADTRLYKRFLKTYFDSLNFEILYAKKRGDVNEGAAMIFNPAKLQHLENFDVILSDLLLDEKYEDIKRVAEMDSESYKIFSSRPAIFQVNSFKILHSFKPTILCMSNTHLHFHPMQGHIKLQQTALCLRHLNYVMEKLKIQYPDHRIGLIFCGDLNSLPDSTVLSCLSQGLIQAKNPDWFDKNSENNTVTSSEVKGTEIRVPFKFESVCPARYTNYVGENHFSGCLDYILIGRQNSTDEIFRISKKIPMPQHALVTKYYGLPSKIAPSDHLALVCDIEIVG